MGRCYSPCRGACNGHASIGTSPHIPCIGALDAREHKMPLDYKFCTHPCAFHVHSMQNPHKSCTCFSVYCVYTTRSSHHRTAYSIACAGHACRMKPRHIPCNSTYCDHVCKMCRNLYNGASDVHAYSTQSHRTLCTAFCGDCEDNDCDA